MELVNLLLTLGSEETDSGIAPEVTKEAVDATLLLLSPMTPHLCSELWQITGHETFLEEQPWPSYDPDAARDEEITIVLQVNGKVRGRLVVAPDIEEDELRKLAQQDDKVQKFLAGKSIRKIIVVPGKLVNLVV
jgi:leucyl-tRNA synthetase